MPSNVAELKVKEATASSQLLDWRNAHDRVADEAANLRAQLAEVQAAREREREQKHKLGAMLAVAIFFYF